MIRYTLELASGTKHVFDVDVNGWAAGDVGRPSDILPWERLETFRCDHCPQPASETAACPTAAAVRPVIEAFGANRSFEEALVRVDDGQRSLQLRTSLQDALRSLLGLQMALSSCPVMRKLRPMARFHLPFGDVEHTVFRVMGTYLIAQHLRAEEGLASDRQLTGLADLYERIHVVNERMADRLRLAVGADATVNSLVILDVFAQRVESDLGLRLARWKPLFDAYLTEEAPAPEPPEAAAFF